MSRFTRIPLFCLSISALMSGGFPAHARVQAAAPAPAPTLEVVAELDQRPANIAVTLDGQIIVSLHPFDKPATKLVRITKDGKTEPFPSAEWNSPDGAIDSVPGFINVIGIRATTSGTVLVLDMGDTTHTPRVIEITPAQPPIAAVRYIPREVTTPQSFLQDLAFDWDKGHAYIADMGQADLTKPAQPAIIDLDMKKGWVRRHFADFAGIAAPATPIEAEGKAITIKDGKKDIPVHAALNPITLDVLSDTLYFGPMGAGKLYRMPLARLAEQGLTDQDLQKRIEVVGDKPACDGITVDSAGNIYLGRIDKPEIGVIRPDGKYVPYIQDKRLVWVDGFSFGPDGYIYATVSQLNRAAFFNKGKDTSTKPFLIVRFKPLTDGAIGR